MTAHVHISGKARGILQRMNATGATLHYDRETQSYRIGTEAQNWRACDEILFLGAVQTLSDRKYCADYQISDEGRRILQPGYIPVMKQRRHLSR